MGAHAPLAFPWRRPCWSCWLTTRDMLFLRLSRVGHGLNPSMDWTVLRWIGWDDCDPVFFISNHCSTVDAVSYNMIYERLTIPVLPRLKINIRPRNVDGT